MVSSGRQAIACILLLLSTAASAQSQTVADKGPTSSVSGKVTSKDKAVSGVVVGLVIHDQYRTQSTRLRAVSDDEGKYRITNVPPGSYEVVVSAPVYVASDARKSLIVGKNETVENIDFALMRGGVITGKVTDADGNPVIEEDVSLSPVKPDHRSHYLRSTRTDDRGVYRIFGLPPGPYRVSAGREEDSSFGSRHDRGGHKLTYHPDAADASLAAIIEVSEGSEATNVDITVGRALVTYTASGRIIDGETGQPLANIHYGVQKFINPNRTGTTSAGEVSTKEGEFKLHNLSPGNYAVFLESAGDSDWQAEPVRFEVIDRDVESLIVKTSKAATVSGVIILEGTDDKKILENLLKARIYANVHNRFYGGRGLPSSTINPDGSFRVSGLAAGTLSFSVNSPDRLQVIRMEHDGIILSRGVEVKERELITGLRVVVGHPNAAIRGVVKLATTGSPPSGARFYVSVRKMGEDPSNWMGSRSGQVDARGQFLIQGLLAGTYEIMAGLHIPGEAPIKMPRATQQVVLNSGVVTDVTLTLEPQQSVPVRP